MSTLHERVARALLLIGLAASGSAQALSFNVTYDSSVNSAPAGFKTAFQDAVNYYDSTFANPITIDLNVGWGEVGGSGLSSNALGESKIASLYPTSFNGMISLMSGNPGLSSYYTSSPTNNPSADNILIPSAEVKAMECGPQNTKGGCNSPVSGGAVGFGSSYSWDFNPGGTPLSSQYYFVGVAEHEISEVMGRISFRDSSACSSIIGTSPCFAPLDLFRYDSNGTFDPTNGTIFSTNGGKTRVNTFNSNSSGDYGDWSGSTLDAYNAFFSSGKVYPISSGDVAEMNVLGYNTTVPLPDAFWLLGSGLLVLVAGTRRARSSV